jgi:multidrug efflux pump subunit AcrA (membrane-fusion protein)
MLQVRVDVPLADFSKLRVGSRAEVVTEALPELVLHGKLIRIVHEANIQRNTVPVKVAIENPSEVLKPEMLARVRFYGDTPTKSSTRGVNAGTDNGGGLRLLVPKQALLDQQAELARVWMVKHDARTSGMIASSQEITTAPSNVPGFVEVLSGLQAGDRVIVDAPSDLQDGHRVRILGESNLQSLSENQT